MALKTEYDRLDDEDYDYEDELSTGIVSSWYNHESVALIHEPEDAKLKFLPATAIMVASMTGIGVLALPHAFVSAGGPFYGVCIQIPFLIFCWISINAIGLIIRKYNVDEYENMVSAVLGDRVGKICKIFFVLYCLANCIAYTLVVMEQGHAFLPGLPSLAGPLLSVILVPFSCAKNVAFLKHGGYVSILAMIVLASAVTIDYFLHETTHVHANISSQAELKIDVGPTYSTNMQGVFSSLPIFCFAYQSHMSSVKIYRRIEHPKSYPYITAVAFLITFVLYNVTGVMSLLTFGASIDPEMLNSYSKSDFPILFARTGIVGCIMGAYPVFTLMARDMIRKTENFRFRIMFGIVWFIICAFCAMLIPNFQVASAVIGSMAALLMFVFPGLTLLVSYVERKFYRCILGVFFTVVGVFLFVYSFIAALMA